MKNSVPLLVILLFITLSTISSYEATTTTTKSFSVDLIHRDSPLSPMYNSSMTQSELLQNAAFRSISRHNMHNNYNNNANNNIGYGSKVQTTIIPNSGDYLMRIYLGNPPVESLVIADTATDLSWIQCQPCWQCYQQDAPIFDPKNSHTYKVQDCSSESCEWLFTHACGDSRECKYSERYGDSSESIGELAIDFIGFGPGTTYYPNFLFGCGHYNVGKFTRVGSGLAGLGRGHMSLMTQLGDQIGHKFSYCLNSVYYTGPVTISRLMFGSESTISDVGLVTVPLETGVFQTSTYNLNLEGISIGNTKVQPDHMDIIMVDAATTMTLLESSFYDKVSSAILKYIGLRPVLKPPNHYKLCFEEGRGDFPFPNITFHFSGANSGLQMKSYHLFGRLNNLVCLLIIPNKGYSILGNMAQVNFEVQYDLEERKVSFAPTDCSKA